MLGFCFIINPCKAEPSETKPFNWLLECPDYTGDMVVHIHLYLNGRDSTFYNIICCLKLNISPH